MCSVTQSCMTLRLHGLCPARLLCPWDSPGKNTGVGCHALLQGIFPTQRSNPCLLHWQPDSLPLIHLGSPNTMLAAAAAAKSLQSCPTLSDPMHCSPPGSSVHGIFQARVLEWGAIAFSNTMFSRP